MYKTIWLVGAIFTGLVSYNLHHDGLLAIFQGFFWIITWIVWLANHSVHLSLIKQTFSWFFQ